MAHSLSFLLVLLATVAVIATLCLSPASAAKCHPEDKKALLAIKQFWNNPHRLASWVPSTGCCAWYGVDCEYVTGRVTNLFLTDDANITGSIPPPLGDLPHLSQLEISRLPNLTGPIPSALSRLRNLTLLSLNGNGLTGPIPGFVTQLPELWHLNLGSNRLTGSIPAALSRLTKLRYLALDHNRLTGTIPAEFRKLPSGIVLLVSHNNLSDPVPPALGAVDFASINLSSNQLSGDATFLFGLNKVKLSHIDLSSNQFEFDLGRVLFPVPQLYAVRLSHNRIYGRIPEQIADVLDLVSLDLSYNRLCGKIPTGGNLDEFTAEVYANNPCLCGKPLAPCK